MDGPVDIKVGTNIDPTEIYIRLITADGHIEKSLATNQARLIADLLNAAADTIDPPQEPRGGFTA